MESAPRILEKKETQHEEPYFRFTPDRGGCSGTIRSGYHPGSREVDGSSGQIASKEACQGQQAGDAGHNCS
jgi:hypothetical protein